MTMKIWLLFSGSLEPENSEAAACFRLKEEAEKIGHQVEILNPEHFDLLVDSTDDWQATYQGAEIQAPDLIIPRTGSETTYTGFALMRFYESMGVPLLNSSRAVEMAADKLYSQQILAAHKIPLPKTILGRFPADLDLIEQQIGFPVVVKTLSGTRGGGVFLAETRQKFRDLTDLIAETNSNVHFIFQQYIKQSHGRDLRVFCVDGKVLACMERNAVDGSFKSNISLGGVGKPHPVTPEIEKIALQITNVLGMDVAGIDLLFDRKGYLVCEVNSAPDFTGPVGMEAACSINVARYIILAGVAKMTRQKGLWSRLRTLSGVA
ncbi:MAG: ATP-grasp domain-containing protein [Micavibrio sp.]